MKRILAAISAVIMYSGMAVAGHYGAVDVRCSNCHTPNFIAEHGGFAKDSCNRCHSSTNPQVVTAIQNGSQGQIVSCGNCHGTASHLDKHPSYISSFTSYSGVEPGPAPIWTQPTAFTDLSSSTKQYQLCLKCHSYNGLGTMPSGISGYVGPSGTKFTDQAMEFNVNNKSAHPVLNSLNNQTGSYAPKALTAARMKAPWTNVGNQTMLCSDCHDNTGTGPQAPMAKFMLKGTGKNWPTDATGNLFKLGRTSTALFCKNCHVVDGTNNVHSEGDHSGYACVACHLAIPHGGKRSRLFVYTKDPAPYNYNGNSAKMTGFKKSTRYGESGSCSATGCDEHGGTLSGADQ